MTLLFMMTTNFGFRNFSILFENLFLKFKFKSNFKMLFVILICDTIKYEVTFNFSAIITRSRSYQCQWLMYYLEISGILLYQRKFNFCLYQHLLTIFSKIIITACQTFQGNTLFLLV